MTAFQEALGIIADNPEHANFVGQRDVQLINEAERVLGFNFPPQYREFVKTLGAGNFGSFEVYGVVDRNFDQSSIPNTVWLTLDMRRRSKLTSDLLPICDLGYGGYYCIERRGADYPVVVFEFGMAAGRRYEVEAVDFGEFFLQGVRRQLLRLSS